MSNETLALFNVFMVVTSCWTAFWLGAAWQIGRDMKEERQRRLDRLIDSQPRV